VNSKPGEKAIERIAADANVILSAIIGKAALRVFTRSSLEIVTTSTILKEVQEYLPSMAESYKIAPEVLEGQLRLLGIKEYQPRDYRRYIPEATRRIGARDPDDIDLLALALAQRIPIWSNDKDFEASGIEWYSTAELLKKLKI